jgi:hypothetical protein
LFKVSFLYPIYDFGEVFGGFSIHWNEKFLLPILGPGRQLIAVVYKFVENGPVTDNLAGAIFPNQPVPKCRAGREAVIVLLRLNEDVSVKQGGAVRRPPTNKNSFCPQTPV